MFSRTNTTVHFLVIISKPWWHFIWVFLYRRCYSWLRISGAVGGGTAALLVCERAASSERHHVMASCDVIAQGSVSWQRPQSLFFLIKGHSSLCSFFTLKKMKWFILSVLKYIMSKREKIKKEKELFYFHLTW